MFCTKSGIVQTQHLMFRSLCSTCGLGCPKVGFWSVCKLGSWYVWLFGAPPRMTPQGALMQWVNTQHISTPQLANWPKSNFRTAYPPSKNTQIKMLTHFTTDRWRFSSRQTTAFIHFESIAKMVQYLFFICMRKLVVGFILVSLLCLRVKLGSLAHL